jgi:hypothetical protein
MYRIAAVLTAAVAVLAVGTIAPAQAQQWGPHTVHAAPYDVDGDGGSWSWYDGTANTGTIYAKAPSAAYNFWLKVAADPGTPTVYLRSTGNLRAGWYGLLSEVPTVKRQHAEFYNVVVVGKDGSRRVFLYQLISYGVKR